MSTLDEAFSGPQLSSEVAIPLDRKKVILVFVGLMLGMFLAALDSTIVSTALPDIVGALHGASHLSWVVTAYLLTSTISTPMWGKLGDLYGRKRFFQAAIVIFIIGSVLSGFSSSMLELIIFRGIQGLGGGGLVIGAQSIIGDVVAPKDRGRYVGIFGAMFGVATVIGPLLGGIFVSTIGWRWIFFINVPLAAVALIVTAIVLPAQSRRVAHVFDVAGLVVLTIGVSGLVLFCSLGGEGGLAWGSPTLLSFLVIGIVASVAFVFVERRAVEPIIPMRLFKNRTIAVGSALSFLLGFAMFGALTFLPLFLQIAKGVSPTESGLRLLPLMGGLFLTSILSGQLIARGDGYRKYPIIGTVLMVVGLYLMSLITVATNNWVAAFYMFIFGVGMGCLMQVLILAVQNAADYKDLGTATATATFFRMIGSSFGAAIFGAIFSNVFPGNLSRALGGASFPSNVSPDAITPEVLAKLPAEVRAALATATSQSFSTLMLWAIPVALIAFVIAWFLPQLELRSSQGPGMASVLEALADDEMAVTSGEAQIRADR